MEMLPGKKFWNSAIALLTVAAVSFIPAAALELPKGEVLEYHHYSGEAIRMTGRHLEQIAEKSIWDTRLDEERIRFALTWFTAAKLAVDVSGLAEAKSFQQFSRQLPGGVIVTEEFLELDPSVPGLINQFPAAENRIDPARFISQLPPDTQLALSADIRPESLLEILGRCGAYREKLLAALPEQFPLQEMLRQSSGVWTLIFINEKEFCLMLPDREGMIFNFAALMTGVNLRKHKVSKLNFNGMIVVRGDGWVQFFSSAAMQKKIVQSVQSQALPGLPGIPDKAFAVLYAASGYGNDLKINNIDIMLPDCRIPDITALRREKNGIRLCSSGGTTLLTEGVDILLALLPELSKVRFPEKIAPAVKPVQKKEVPQQECGCRQLLLNPALKAAVDGNIAPGYYSLTPAGLLKASPEKYDLVFFGICDSDKVYPQFICVPHKAEFCVRFSDGTTARCHLVNPGSFRRIIGYLMTVKKYDEKLFRELIQTAEKLDRMSAPEK
ncbi:MAG: hypothetical protein E7058_03755 [Lentisphaerae bacterium]|nr:hypothetical protein [Lentisphaerota bacterium]